MAEVWPPNHNPDSKTGRTCHWGCHLAFHVLPIRLPGSRCNPEQLPQVSPDRFCRRNDRLDLQFNQIIYSLCMNQC
jgi:hypothetical protein